MVLDTDTRMPEKLNINYDDHIANVKVGEQREFKNGDITQSKTSSQQNIPTPQNPSIVNIVSSQKQQPPPPQNKKIQSLLD